MGPEKVKKTVVKEEKGQEKEKGPKTLPENALERHPVQLLNEMEGPLTYEEDGLCGTIGVGGMFKLCVTVKGQEFRGTARTKKEAKKLAAANALSAIYGVNY